MDTSKNLISWANCCVARHSQPRRTHCTVSVTKFRAPLALSRAASAAVLTDTPFAGALHPNI
jgi:hypothetical protein